MATNLGLEFNKRVYLNLRKDPLNNENYRNDNMRLYQNLITTRLADLSPDQLNLKDKFDKNYKYFTLTTSGQGFLVGTGNEHGTGSKVKVNGKEIDSHEFKMGFHFDHSTGIPVITGHNLKGRIRSFFPIAYNSAHKKIAIANRLIGDLNVCFKNDNSINVDNWNTTEIKKLENLIFEGEIEMGVRINPLIQDSFLGAYPSKSNSKEFSYTIPKHYISTSKTTGKQSDKFDQEETIKIPAGTFLFDDTLAFHKHPLKDPMPIRLLKILPEIDIQFQFRLNDLGGLSGQQKATLFKYLLNKYGAGAKTSSGYGQFRKQQENGTSSKALNSNLFFDDFNPIAININTADTENEYPVPEKLITKLPKLQETDTWIPLESLKNGSIVSGTVVDFVSGNAKIQLHIKEHIIILGLQGKFVLHNEVRLKIVETSGSLMKGNYQITKISKM